MHVPSNPRFLVKLESLRTHFRFDRCALTHLALQFLDWWTKAMNAMQSRRVGVVGEGGPPVESSPADPASSVQVSAFRNEVKSVFASGTGIDELKVEQAAKKWKHPG